MLATPLTEIGTKVSPWLEQKASKKLSTTHAGELSIAALNTSIILGDRTNGASDIATAGRGLRIAKNGICESKGDGEKSKTGHQLAKATGVGDKRAAGGMSRRVRLLTFGPVERVVCERQWRWALNKFSWFTKQRFLTTACILLVIIVMVRTNGGELLLQLLERPGNLKGGHRAGSVVGA